MKSRYLNLFAIFFLSATIFVIYFNSLHSPFMIDDGNLIEHNSYIRDFHDARHLFTREYYLYFGEKTYRPVNTFSYFADYALYGLNPTGFHVTNTLFHVVSTILIYVLIMQATSNFLPAFLTAILFAVHPVHTEAIDLVSYREDMMAMAFSLCAMFAGLKSMSATGIKKFSYVAGALVFFALGIFSKETALVTPAAMLLYHVTFFSGNIRAALRDRKYLYLGFLFVLLFYFSVTRLFLYNPLTESHEVGIFANDKAAAFLTTCKVFIYYIKNLVFPLELYAEYMVSVSHSLLDPAVFFSLVVLLCLLGLGMILYAEHKEISFGILYFLISLLPISNIVPFGNFMSDRYLYMPSMGFCLVLSSLLLKMHEKRRALFLTLVCGLVLFYSSLTVRQNTLWHDEERLWKHVMEKFPNSPNANAELSQISFQRGREQEAMERIQKAIQFSPDYAGFYLFRGVMYYTEGQMDAALFDFNKVIQLTPSNIGGYANRGIVYTAKGMPDAAIADFTKAAQLNPRYADAYYNRALAYEMKGSLDEALQDFSRVLSLNPEDAEAYNARGMIFMKKGFREDALTDFKTSARLGNKEARMNLERFGSTKPQEATKHGK